MNSAGQPLHNALVWLDRRTAAICQRLTKELGSAVRNPRFQQCAENMVLMRSLGCMPCLQMHVQIVTRAGSANIGSLCPQLAKALSACYPGLPALLDSLMSQGVAKLSSGTHSLRSS